MIRELRTWSRAPVIVLSGRTGSGDKIGALDAGADDYVTKPFSMEELLARLRAALRRDERRRPADQVQSSARCVVDLAAPRPCPGTASRSGSPPPSGGCWRSWSATPASWCGGRRLLTEVWGPGYEQSGHYLRFHMAGLRRKLEDDPARPQHLLTEPGMGYRFQP